MSWQCTFRNACPVISTDCSSLYSENHTRHNAVREDGADRKERIRNGAFFNYIIADSDGDSDPKIRNRARGIWKEESYWLDEDANWVYTNEKRNIKLKMCLLAITYISEDSHMAILLRDIIDSQYICAHRPLSKCELGKYCARAIVSKIEDVGARRPNVTEASAGKKVETSASTWRVSHG